MAAGLARCSQQRGLLRRNDNQVKLQKHRGWVSSLTKSVTLDQFTGEWLSRKQAADSSGWRVAQQNKYCKYIQPFIGNKALQKITANEIETVLSRMAVSGLSEQTRLHVFNILRKLFGDAIEEQLLSHNPAAIRLKPRVPSREAEHLNLDQVRRLLIFAKDKPYGVGIWIQLYVGLRISELQALKWSDVDLDSSVVHIRRVYVRNKKIIRDYPKGRRQHSEPIPPELLQFLRQAKSTSSGEYVVPSSTGEMFPYDGYYKALQRYCKSDGINIVATHGLRHSTSAIYKSHGATDADISNLFEHSSMKVTQRYIHTKETNLEKVASVIRLFPEEECCTNVAQSPTDEVDDGKKVC